MKKDTHKITREKLAGLRILIDHSFLLNTDEKQTLMTKLETMKLPEVDALGQFLAWEKQSALAANDEIASLQNSLKNYI